MNKNLPTSKTRVDRLFANIAPWYDFLNHFLSLGVDFYWRKKLIQNINPFPQMQVLDLACGTFDVGLALLKKEPKAKVVGVDYTFNMLKAGKQKIAKARKSVHPIQGDGRNLPFKDDFFDAVSIAFGIRNITPRKLAYAEIWRVLKPGGKFFILEFGSAKQKIWKGLYNFYLARILPFLGGMFSKDIEAYKYLAKTVQEFPLPKELAEELEEAGFKEVDYLPLTSGIVYIHWGKKLTSH